jgi:hypothetical protein
MQQFSLQFIFDVEIQKTQVSLSSHDEQCQPDCLSVYFLTPDLLQPYLTLCVVHT